MCTTKISLKSGVLPAVLLLLFMQHVRVVAHGGWSIRSESAVLAEERRIGWWWDAPETSTGTQLPFLLPPKIVLLRVLMAIYRIKEGAETPRSPFPPPSFTFGRNSR